MSVIRTAHPDEYEFVGHLTYLGFGHGEPGARQPNPERAELLLNAAARAAAGDLLVAEDGGRLLGTASLLEGGGPLTRETEVGEAELRLLAVLPEARGRGLGRRLMEASIERARARGASALVLDTGPSNFRSQRLYHRLGFRRVVERETKPSLNGEPLALFVYDFHPTDPLRTRIAWVDEHDAVVGLLTGDRRGEAARDDAAVASLSHEYEVWVVEQRRDRRIVGAVIALRPDEASRPDVLLPDSAPAGLRRVSGVAADADDPDAVHAAIAEHLEWLRFVRVRLARHERIA